MKSLFAAVCLLCPIGLDAQDVKVRLCDGRELQGKFKSDGNGKCHVLGEGVSYEFEETDIVSLQILMPAQKISVPGVDRTAVRRMMEAAKAVGTASSLHPVSFLRRELRKYCPLTVGRYWVYKVGEDEALQRIEVIETLRGGDALRIYYTVEDVYKNYRSSKVCQLVAEPDAVYLPSGAAKNGHDRFPLLRIPLKVGDNWETTYNSQRLVREVRSVTATVATPGGTFEDCLEVSLTTSVFRLTEETRIVSRRFYAPGVGLVKLEFDEPGYRKMNLDLVEHGVK